MTGSYVMIHMPYVMMVLLNGNDSHIWWMLQKKSPILNYERIDTH